jgi:cyanophycinase
MLLIDVLFALVLLGSTPLTGVLASEPPPDPALDRYLLGNPVDATVARQGGLLLVGGGDPPVEALRWMLDRAPGGDVVVLGASGGRGFDAELASAGRPNSVRTFILRARAAAYDPLVLRAVRNAEAVYVEGGDQARYLRFMRETPLQQALQQAHESGAVIGGSSAGLAILGQYLFGAVKDTVHSRQALADPLDERVVVEPAFLDLANLRGVLTDTHFANRDRMGRLAAFLAAIHARWRPAQARAVAVDEDNAVTVEPSGRCRLHGNGHAYFVTAPHPAEVFSRGVPLTLRELGVERLDRSGSFELRGWRGTGTLRYRLDVERGKLRSSQPRGRVY